MEALGEALKFEPQVPDNGLQGVPGSTGVQPHGPQRQTQDWRRDMVTKQKTVTVSVIPSAYSKCRFNLATPEQEVFQVSTTRRLDCSFMVGHRHPQLRSSEKCRVLTQPRYPHRPSNRPHIRVGRSERRCLDSGDVEARSGQG